jgi:hypothetical protein
MKITQFLEHHGVKDNPFGQEDAQSDQVFRQHCLDSAHHPAWAKILGSPNEPSTAIVFGEKGAGKTALRLQLVEEISHFNAINPGKRVFIIEYDDLNPFLDCYKEKFSSFRKSPERALARWRLWDHMDSILTIGVTGLVNIIVGDPPVKQDDSNMISRAQIQGLSPLQRRDLLLLATFYDHSRAMSPKQRWSTLRKKLGFSVWRAHLDLLAGCGVTLLLLLCWWKYPFVTTADRFTFLTSPWFWLIMAIGLGAWLWRQLGLFWTAFRIDRQVRVIDHHVNTLRGMLSNFERQHLANQPLPSRDRSDDRYELINKFRGVLQTLGFDGIIVIMDRVDEPHLINGSAERMKSFLWSMFDNKFLKIPGMGFKLLLPKEVYPYLNRGDREFYERSRLDKQNLIQSLEWTGESLYDLANVRLAACSSIPNAKPSIKDWFEESISQSELMTTLSRLRVPRHLFKFLYRLLVAHCNRSTEENPQWKIDRATLQSEMALFMRDLEAIDKGMGVG